MTTPPARQWRPLRLALVGHGRMGRAVERVAQARGHEIGVRVASRQGDGRVALDHADFADIDVAIEFTRPDVAPAAVRMLVQRRLPTVSGTTGWMSELESVRELAAARRVGFLWAANFSLGMSVLARLVERAARDMAACGGFEPFVTEAHHRGKRDAPSGTACRLAELVVAQTAGKSRFGAAPEQGPIPDELVSVSWTRAGAIPGTHTVGWDAEHETLEISHRVRDRSVFAEGAVRAAEWIIEQDGPRTLDELIDAGRSSKTDDVK